MNTAEIIERCRELPGVTVNAGDGYAELMLSNAEGKGRMCFCPVFPGDNACRDIRRRAGMARAGGGELHA